MGSGDYLRRRMLGGMGMMLGLAGCGGFPGGQQEKSETESERPSTGTNTTRNLQPSESGVLAAREGLVVPVAAGLDPTDAVDPDSTSTPVGDAVEKINDVGQGRGFGTVLLPPTVVTEAEPITPTQYLQILGWGINTSGIESTDLSSDGIRVTTLKEGRYVYLDGFTIDGSDKSDRSGGSAIHFINDSGTNPKHFDIGRLAFRNWIDPVVHFEQGSPFGCHWGHLDFGFGLNNGREIALEQNQSILGTQIGFISAGNATRQPVLTTNFSGARLHIGFLNIGGSAGQAVRIKSTQNGHVSIGGVNYESGVDIDGAVVELKGPASTHIEYVKNTNATVDSVVNLAERNGNNVLGRIRVASNASVRTGKIDLTAEPVGPSFYFGPREDIINTVGANSRRVWALGSMSPVDGAPTTSQTVGIDEFAQENLDRLGEGEMGVTPGDADEAPALVYRDRSGELHFWTTD